MQVRMVMVWAWGPVLGLRLLRWAPVCRALWQLNWLVERAGNLIYLNLKYTRAAREGR